MSHNIHYADYEENVDKSMVQAEWDDYAAHEDWQEGCCGLDKDIRWINHVCDSYEQAKEYIEEHDSGCYDQLAVKYIEYEKPTTKAYKNLLERRKEVYSALQERESKIHYSFENTKSRYVACKHCGSRLATVHIHSNLCPLCWADLRPASARKAIATSKKMIKDIDEKLEAMERKQTKKSKIKWLVKIEYHT